MYGGPRQKKAEVPTFEALIKNRVLGEVRFFCNNSNAKWLSLGVVPATKLLNEDAPGFYFEAFLCGDKNGTLPLGGISGLNALFSVIREIPKFSVLPNLQASNGEISEKITISTVNFAEDVSFHSFFYIYFLLSFLLLLILHSINTH